MKYTFTILFFTLTLTGLMAQTGTGKLPGTYEYRVNTELGPYVSRIGIKPNGQFVREIRNPQHTRKTTGTWLLKDDALWLTPHKKYKQEPYSLQIAEGYLKIGEVGIHEKLK